MSGVRVKGLEWLSKFKPESWWGHLGLGAIGAQKHIPTWDGGCGGQDTQTHPVSCPVPSAPSTQETSLSWWSRTQLSHLELSPSRQTSSPGQKRNQSICWPHPRCCLMRPVHRLVSLPHGCWPVTPHATGHTRLSQGQGTCQAPGRARPKRVDPDTTLDTLGWPGTAGKGDGMGHSEGLAQGPGGRWKV